MDGQCSEYVAEVDNYGACTYTVDVLKYRLVDATWQHLINSPKNEQDISYISPQIFEKNIFSLTNRQHEKRFYHELKASTRLQNNLRHHYYFNLFSLTSEVYKIRMK